MFVQTQRNKSLSNFCYRKSVVALNGRNNIPFYSIDNHAYDLDLSYKINVQHKTRAASC